jgi:hypothetical protein
MRRFAAIILALAFVALGSGATQYLHELQHLWEDAANGGCPPGDPASGPPVHDESNCVIHAVLRVPIPPIMSVPPVVPAGTLLARLVVPDQTTDAQTCPGRVDCRGPPSC